MHSILVYVARDNMIFQFYLMLQLSPMRMITILSYWKQISSLVPLPSD